MDFSKVSKINEDSFYSGVSVTHFNYQSFKALKNLFL